MYGASDKVAKALEYMCMRWSSDDEIEHTFESRVDSKQPADSGRENVLERTCLTVFMEA